MYTPRNSNIGVVHTQTLNAANINILVLFCLQKFILLLTLARVRARACVYAGNRSRSITPTNDLSDKFSRNRCLKKETY